MNFSVNDIQTQMNGLVRTQAKFVYVRTDLVATILGDDITNHICLQKTNVASAPARSTELGVAIQHITKKSSNHGLGKFNRAQLFALLHERIEEAGGIKAFVEEDSDVELTELEKVRKQLSSSSPPEENVPSPEENDEDEDF